MEDSLIHFGGDEDMALRQIQAGAQTKVQYLHYRYKNSSSWFTEPTERTFRLLPGSDNAVSIRILSCAIRMSQPLFGGDVPLFLEVNFTGFASMGDETTMRSMQDFGLASELLGIVGVTFRDPASTTNGLVSTTVPGPHPAIRGTLPPGVDQTWNIWFYDPVAQQTVYPQLVDMVLEVVG
jgi:hypothetical protein